MKDRKPPSPTDDPPARGPFDSLPFIEDSALADDRPSRGSTAVVELSAESVGTQVTMLDAAESFSTLSTDGGATTVGEGSSVELASNDASTGSLSAHAVVGEFVLEDLLGAGTFAEVYRARHVESGRIVALKVLKRALAYDETVRRRVLREGEILKGLRHPNLVEVYDVGLIEDGRAFIVMELLRGRTLRDLLTREAPLSPDRAYRLTEQIASGLDAAHRAGIIHRDLKPANIWVLGESPFEQVKLLDFGLARLVDRGEFTQLTRAGDVIGSPAFMAPEQVRDPTKADARSDLYALGITAFAMVMGRLPFVGRMRDVLEAQVRIQPEPLPLLGGFELVIASLMNKDPEQRPSSAAELLERIQAVAEPTMVPSSTWPRLSVSVTDVAAPSLTPARGPRKSLGPWIFGGLALLAVASATGLAWRNHDPTTVVVNTQAPVSARAEPLRVEAEVLPVTRNQPQADLRDDSSVDVGSSEVNEESSRSLDRANRPRSLKVKVGTSSDGELARARARLSAAARKRHLRPQDLRALLPGEAGLGDEQLTRGQLDDLVDRIGSAPITEGLVRTRMKRLLGKLGALSERDPALPEFAQLEAEYFRLRKVVSEAREDRALLERANARIDELETELDSHR